jgi:hypothetical protein
MNDVDRLFRRLVQVLSAAGAELRESIEIPVLYQKLVPYRTNRGALRFDSNEDYEMALLRLLAGEHGYLEVEPPEVAQALAEEARAVNPNPGAFRSYTQGRVRLSFRALRELFDGEVPYAPNVPDRVAEPGIAGSAAEAPAGVTAPVQCPHCDRALPHGRVINFCPHCGDDVKVRTCPQCGTELELDWRHCVTCGYRAG